ncbi:MAG: WGR domain-containing protein [Candidatus Thiodiazotropha sp. (ex Rostrolucina anterorostrata)]|nr:WGR domain-containing protein [Candidatus Thiodiazotropha sp. (ex Rostrolucina anterorostrata)]
MNRIWVHPDKRRYYRAHLQTDLFGDWTLTRSWGSLDSHHGQVRTELVDSKTNGQQILADIDKRRACRGYRSALGKV